MLWLIPLLPLVAAPLLYPVWKRAGRSALAASTALIGIVVFALLLVAINDDWTGVYQWSDSLTLTLGLTGLTPVFALTLPMVASLILVFSASHEDRSGLARLMGFLVAFLGAMELLLLARDLLTLLIGWELVGALSWALIAHHGTEAFRVRQAGWAFLVTRFGDLGLYLAAAVAFSSTGSLGYESLAQLEGTALHLFVAGIVLACAAKSAQLPFSPWLFAAMAGPSPVSALLHSATMVAAGVYLIAMLEETLSKAEWFGSLAVWLGLATAVAGGLVALFQHHAKRLLAASTFAHHGLMWVAVGAGYPAVAALHFTAHAVAKAPLFLLVGIAGKQVGSHWLRDLSDGPFPRKMAWASLMAVAALAGVFPLGAAWTKESIVSAANHYGLWAAWVCMVAGGLSAAYAARFHGVVFGWKKVVGRGPAFERPTWVLRSVLPFSATTLASVLLWLPNSRSWLMTGMGVELPAFKLWETVASLTLVALGLGLGVYLAHKPSLARTSHPNGSFSRVYLAQFARLLAGLNRFEQQMERLVPPVPAFFHALARVDQRWDRAIDGTVHQFCRLADASRRFAEWVFDELPEDAAHLFSVVAHRAVRVQTGMVHHYYSLAAIGFAVVILVLIMGALL